MAIIHSCVSLPEAGGCPKIALRMEHHLRKPIAGMLVLHVRNGSVCERTMGRPPD